MSDLKKLHDALLAGDAKTVVAVTKEALEGGIAPGDLVYKHMVPALGEAGAKFEANELFVPELLLIARAMKNAMEIIRPLLAKSGAKPVGRVAIGTVKGDLHDIGKNLVASMLEGGGFEVVDLGVDVGAEKFIAAVKEKSVNVIALSALLTTTMPFIKTVIEALKSSGLRDKVKVIVGGAPVTQDYANEVGADGYSDNANGAVNIARKLVA
ncbi:MAG TPA: corrinoid protein [Phycisphaerae bacterium]|nr:corrinoid protein [Phycisphaerae bacterium]HRY68800.1 corrinoid protein [Phycisphaerae bacterium]HSA27463.1 corrinoid protein [Phycisphaerae bacterium]